MEFRSRVTQQIIEKFGKPKYLKICPKSPGTQPFRLSGRHFRKLSLAEKVTKVERDAWCALKIRKSGNKHSIMNAKYVM